MLKKFAALAFLLIVILLIPLAEGNISVGVKPGDWMEYSVSTTGTPPEGHDVTWARMEILDVEGEVLHANITVRNIDGVVSSSVRQFNFTSGQVQAWIIIPANLSPGDTFYDSSIPGDVTIQGQEQKIVAGASRTITHANDSSKYKEWDKATGMYTETKDHLANYTIDAFATATNMWAPQILGLDPTIFYAIIIIVVAVIVVAVLVLVVFRRKRK
jgi:hypothetical protein